jgi:LysM repeat protein
VTRNRVFRLFVSLLLTVTLGGCANEGPSHPTPTPDDALVIVTPTPGTPIPQTPTPRSAQTTYVVQPGDSLSGIATKFGISQEELQQANNINDPDSIYAGQELIIPAR